MRIGYGRFVVIKKMLYSKLKFLKKEYEESIDILSNFIGGSSESSDKFEEEI